MFVFTENYIHDDDDGVHEKHKDLKDCHGKVVKLYEGGEGYNTILI